VSSTSVTSGTQVFFAVTLDAPCSFGKRA
jgi:hypothetical protein